MSTPKIFEVSKKHAQRKSRAACCRGFSRGVNKTNYATDKPRERLRKRLKKKKKKKKSHGRQKPLVDLKTLTSGYKQINYL